MAVCQNMKKKKIFSFYLIISATVLIIVPVNMQSNYGLDLFKKQYTVSFS